MHRRSLFVSVDVASATATTPAPQSPINLSGGVFAAVLQHADDLLGCAIHPIRLGVGDLRLEPVHDRAIGGYFFKRTQFGLG